MYMFTIMKDIYIYIHILHMWDAEIYTVDHIHI